MREDHSSEQPAPDETAEAEQQPMNRAERRAKGKQSGQQQAYGKQAFAPKKSQGHGPRLWANRRAG
ncbi:hypothetical protein ACFQY4_32465 [Catellatospora bangladeshensis]|uniref:Uncharacterized protein n=1 Tax=Catellatospora bangladeshensis TaxID=310355 RepID=A0A8J3JNM2_9ACTN|nr:MULTISPECIES: hypothetical protein [Catellatospora]BCJ74041.1 hypothetical protein CS0771_35850 [Catellatospora sp. IY07-71]GIF83992.1 hypothetical protein Cba03nite_53410 [Catellatospora bangladeshensis]